MVEIYSISHNSPDKEEQLVLSFEDNNPEDEVILDEIFNVLKKQKRCDTCVNYKLEWALGDYQATYCKKHGCLEYIFSPYFGNDGSKCEDYKRKEGM